MILDFTFDLILVEKIAKTVDENCEKRRFLHFTAKSILSLFLRKQKLFRNLVLSKCLELKAL